MTIGHWREEAHAALRAAHDAMQRPQTPTADVYATIAARAAVYSRLAHVTEMLVGGPPGTRFRYGATLIKGPYRQAVNRFYTGLQTAIDHQAYPPVATHPGQEVAQSLHRAADALSIIGDIVATHVVPGQRPRTPEGAAIRSGAGVQSALGSIARLGIDARRIDEQLASWLDRGSEPWTIVYQPVVAAAEAVAASGFDKATQSLLAGAEGRPELLDELALARRPLDPAPTVATTDAAVAAVTAAQTELWQRHEQFAVTHLHLATQLGLTVHTLADDADSPMLHRWRAATIAAAELRGTPAVDAGLASVGELSEVLRWAREQLNTDQQRPQTPDDLAQTARIKRQMPALARTLHRGLKAAVERGDIFVRESVLQRRAGSVIYQATERWRPAVATDEAVHDLTRTLRQLQAPKLVAGKGTTSSTEAAHAAQLAQGYPSSAQATAAATDRQGTVSSPQHRPRTPDSAQLDPPESR